MLSSSDLIAFVSTTDLDRARVFYAGTLGLISTGESPFACVFDAHGTMLRVTAAPAVTPAPYTILGWAVADIEAAIQALAGRGVAFKRYPELGQDDLGVWTTPAGDRIAWFEDPDGNTLSVTQFIATRKHP